MTTLYFTNTSCSKAAYLANKISGAGFATDGVDFDKTSGTWTHTTKSGKVLREIIPKGNVPGLAMADGTVVSEGIAVHTAISDAAPDANLLGGPPGSPERLLALEYFSFIATDIHGELPQLEVWWRARIHRGRGVAGACPLVACCPVASA
eukprot:TRINITY_DN5927_c0_g1_i2.p1 TRINITY_DN5927_c0_g1~~TRINITY_DN5927_c0_g1_i2.p1  ORF type:complete len:150 (+),score=35.59 TRINITY_DN5927_c0_g1_i2:87-536(+)